MKWWAANQLMDEFFKPAKDYLTNCWQVEPDTVSQQKPKPIFSLRSFSGDTWEPERYREPPQKSQRSPFEKVQFREIRDHGGLMWRRSTCDFSSSVGNSTQSSSIQFKAFYTELNHTATSRVLSRRGFPVHLGFILWVVFKALDESKELLTSYRVCSVLYGIISLFFLHLLFILSSSYLILF